MKKRSEEEAVLLFFDGQHLRVEAGGVALVGQLKETGDASEVIRILNKCIDELGYGLFFQKPKGDMH